MSLTFKNVIGKNHDIYRYPRSLAGGFKYCTRVARNILYLHEGASPRRRYFRIARRAPRARVLYDFTARMHEDDIVYIHQRAKRAGIALKTKYSPLVDIRVNPPFQLELEHCQLTYKAVRH